MDSWQLILTCEHGGNEVPQEYRELFACDQEVLHTHRGVDIGALGWAKWCAEHLCCPLIFSTTTRLLVELNRSLKSRSLFSSYALQLTPEEKERVLQRFYFPYRQEVSSLIKKHIDDGKRVIHLSIHSFTPVFHGIKRNADIGLLYDSRRSLEKKFCQAMGQQFCHTSSFPLRYNYPYRGNADGLTTSLRSVFPESHYLGIEIEINQRFGVKGSKIEDALLQSLLLAIKTALERMNA